MKVSVQLPGNSANTVCLTSEKGKVAIGSNRLWDRLASEAIYSCYATGQKRPGLVTIKENRCLTMAHSHVYSLRVGWAGVDWTGLQTRNTWLAKPRREWRTTEFATTKASRKQEPGESQSIRIQAETKQQRHDRLQIARDNTACRTTKQTATASTKCCYVQREQEATTSTRLK